MSKFLNKIFNKMTLSVIAILIQIAIIIVIFIVSQSIPGFEYAYLGLRIVGLVIAIIIVNSRMDASYKVSWLFFMIIFPVFGAVCYLLFANKKFTKKEIKTYAPMLKDYIDMMEKMPKDTFAEIDRNKNPESYNIASYLVNFNIAAPFKSTKVSYYAWGEDGFPTMLEKLKAAKKFIFMEYFIINEGKMWNAILDILKEKAKEGVEIRLMYDDLGSKAFPSNYPQKLAEFGIHAVCFAPIRPLLDIRMNNRDHRKILVIDGLVAFSGGINISDEYINEKVRFGKWKDNIIMLEGDGVFGMLTLFTSNWTFATNNSIDLKYDFKFYMDCCFNNPKSAAGFVQPYGSVPYTYETVGENVYINLAMKSKHYLYISTPYLILDDGMKSAICLAAKNGVDVRLVMPGIPDKKAVFELSRSFYADLIDSGVKIYEYTPGFVHQKVFLVDDIMGTVGTINLDYRSLYLHLENGIFLYHTDCLKDMKQDFEEMFKASKEITYEMATKISFFKKVFRAVLKIISPLL